MNYKKISGDFSELENKTKSLVNQYNKTVDSIKGQELQISKVSQKLDYAIVKANEFKQAMKENPNAKTGDKLDKQNDQIKNYKRQLDVLNSKLSESKNKANDLKKSINDAFNKKPNIGNFAGPIKEQIDKSTSSLKKFGKKAISYMNTKGIAKGVDDINSKFDKFRKRVMRLAGTVIVFNLFRKAITSLRNNFMTLLNADDAVGSSLNQIKANLMTAFAPIYNAALPAIRMLMSALSQLTGTLAAFTSNLFGTSLKDAKKQAQGLSKALDNTSKSGEKASGSLASFDKLEVLNDNDSGGSDSNAIDYSGAVEVNSSLLDTLNKIKEMFKSGDWIGIANMISDAFINTFDRISNWIRNIDVMPVADALNGIFGNLDYSGILVSLVSVFGEAILKFQEFVLAIDWPTILGNLGQGIADAFFKIDEYIGQIKWSEIGTKLSDTFTAIPWGDIGSSILTCLWDSLKGLLDLFLGIDWGQVAETISKAVEDWIQTIIQKFLETDWMQLGKDIVDAIFDFIENTDWLGLGVNIIEGLIVGLKSALELVISVFFELLKRILGLFGIHSPSKVFADIGKYMIQGLVNGLKSLANTVINVFKDIWNGIKAVFSNVADFFGNTFSKAWQKVKDVFSTGGKIFDGIKEGIVSAFTSIVNTIIGGINKVVAVPFNGINNALKKLKKVNIMGLKPFDWISTISVPQLPMLAKGAVIPPRQEFAAILGDQKHGTNIEAPLDTIKQANREVMQEFLGQLGGLNPNEREIVLRNFTIVAQFGNNDFKKLVIDSVRLSEKELGKPLFVS